MVELATVHLEVQVAEPGLLLLADIVRVEAEVRELDDECDLRAGGRVGSRFRECHCRLAGSESNGNDERCENGSGRKGQTHDASL